MNIGDTIKKIRIEKKLKQSELAEKAKISRVAIGNYERGDRQPNIETLNKISEALDITIDDLIKDTDIINLSKSHRDLKEMYSEFLANDSSFNGILTVLESNGYEILQNMKNYDVSIIKNKSTVATVSEKEFIEFGKKMTANIERFTNEFTEFEVYKFISSLEFLYAEA